MTTNPASHIRVPAGLTTEGLLGRRYLARFVDSVLLAVIVAIAVAASSDVMNVMGNPRRASG